MSMKKFLCIFLVCLCLWAHAFWLRGAIDLSLNKVGAHSNNSPQKISRFLKVKDITFYRKTFGVSIWGTIYLDKETGIKYIYVSESSVGSSAITRLWEGTELKCK